MKHGMTIEYLKCRADINFEVDFRVNGAIGTIVTKWNLIVFEKCIVFIHNIFYLNTLHSPLTDEVGSYFVRMFIHNTCTCIIILN